MENFLHSSSAISEHSSKTSVVSTTVPYVGVACFLRRDCSLDGPCQRAVPLFRAAGWPAIMEYCGHNFWLRLVERPLSLHQPHPRKTVFTGLISDRPHLHLDSLSGPKLLSGHRRCVFIRSIPHKRSRDCNRFEFDQFAEYTPRIGHQLLHHSSWEPLK